MEAIKAAKAIAAKKSVVRLSADERGRREAKIRKGKSPAQLLLKAQPASVRNRPELRCHHLILVFLSLFALRFGSARQGAQAAAGLRLEGFEEGFEA